MTDYVSCAPETLYRAGGFPEGPELLAKLQRFEPIADLIEELYPPWHYRRPLPATLSLRDPAIETALRQMCGRIEANHGLGPGSVLVGLDHAVVRKNVVYVRANDRRWCVYESHRPCDRAMAGPLDLNAPAEPFEGLDGPHLYLGSPGSFNYGHWLIDDMPRLKAVPTLGRRYPGATVTLVLPRHDVQIDAVRANAARTFLRGGPPVAIRFVDPEAARSFSRLYFSTPVNDHPVAKSPDALDHLGATLQHWSDGLHKEVLAARLRDLWRSGRPGLRLFVDRNPKRLRDLLNRNAIRTLLRRWGFRVLNTERMPFDKQVALFSNAGIVVGIMGAGMANTLFCRPGTPVVYLAPETWLEAFYWDLAATRGHPYHVLYGPTEAGERSEHLRDFTIDPAELDRVLAGIAGAPLR